MPWRNWWIFSYLGMGGIGQTSATCIKQGFTLAWCGFAHCSSTGSLPYERHYILQFGSYSNTFLYIQSKQFFCQGCACTADGAFSSHSDPVFTWGKSSTCFASFAWAFTLLGCKWRKRAGCGRRNAQAILLPWVRPEWLEDNIKAEANKVGNTVEKQKNIFQVGAWEKSNNEWYEIIYCNLSRATASRYCAFHWCK